MMQIPPARPIFKVFRVGVASPNVNLSDALSMKENTDKNNSSLLIGTPHIPPQFQKYPQNQVPFGSPYIMTTIDYMASIYQYIVYLGWLLCQSQAHKAGAAAIRNILGDCKELLKQLEYAKLHVTDEREKGKPIM
jgi:hypothetical protein